MIRRSLALLLLVIAIHSCRSVKPSINIPPVSDRHVLAVFMDGTHDKPHNCFQRNTNVRKTYLNTNQAIKQFYVNGVGCGIRLRDARRAYTTGGRVMKAYRFLAENYSSSKDSICLFGFSRGANQCRILSSIIYTIGLVDLSKVNESNRDALLLGLYKVYERTINSGKKDSLANYIHAWNQKHKPQEIGYDPHSNIQIELMALWDTVETLGSDYNDRLEIPSPSPRHLNQLCNVKKLYHALSLDDGRAYNYTPILATHRDVELLPGQDINNIVEEVWFNGSHKDVGGGVNNPKNDLMSGISLKWMHSRIKDYNIFNLPDSLRENYLGAIRHMEKDMIGKKTSPRDTLRGLDKYWAIMNPTWNGHRIKIHETVKQRLSVTRIPYKKPSKKGRSYWYEWAPFRDCFEISSDSVKFKGCGYLEVVR